MTKAYSKISGYESPHVYVFVSDKKISTLESVCLENTDPENIGSSSLVLFDVLNYRLGLSSGSTTQFKFLKTKANSFLLCSVCSSFIFVHIEEGLDGVK